MGNRHVLEFVDNKTDEIHYIVLAKDNINKNKLELYEVYFNQDLNEWKIKDLYRYLLNDRLRFTDLFDLLKELDYSIIINFERINFDNYNKFVYLVTDLLRNFKNSNSYIVLKNTRLDLFSDEITRLKIEKLDKLEIERVEGFYRVRYIDKTVCTYRVEEAEIKEDFLTDCSYFIEEIKKELDLSLKIFSEDPYTLNQMSINEQLVKMHCKLFEFVDFMENSLIFPIGEDSYFINDKDLYQTGTLENDVIDILDLDYIETLSLLENLEEIFPEQYLKFLEKNPEYQIKKSIDLLTNM